MRARVVGCRSALTCLDADDLVGVVAPRYTGSSTARGNGLGKRRVSGRGRRGALDGSDPQHDGARHESGSAAHQVDLVTLVAAYPQVSSSTSAEETSSPLSAQK
jgi:hypothetical protein